MKPLVAITHQVFPETVDRLRQVAEVTVPKGESLTNGEWAAALFEADAAMVFMPDRVDQEFLGAGRKLSIVAAALKGCDNIDLSACTRRGVWVSVVPDLLTAPTAELAIGLMIGLARHIREADQHVRSGHFSGWTPRFYGLGLGGSTVGLVGFGAIGRAVAQRLHSFGCQLVYWDERLPKSRTETEGVTAVALHTLLAKSDFVVLCLPLLDSTLHLIDADHLALMRPHALLVNPARGSLVDEAAVAAALQAGRLGGYAADTFELEDLSRVDRPWFIPRALLAHPNTLFTAHIGSATVTARKEIEARAADNILDALAGRTPRDAVNDISGRLAALPAL
jgi:phosphonate dehydrogenase